MKKYLLLLYIFSLLIGQESKNNVALSPVVTYWKTLSIEEKETFLFSYLVQVYETHTELKKDVGYGCLLYTSPSPRDRQKSRMPSSA